MLAVLFGSYSIPITCAGTPSLFLLKSIILYFCLFPPPWCLTVILPWLLRPAFLLFLASNDFSGVLFVISEKSDPVIFLLEGVYGLYVLIPIISLLSSLCNIVFYTLKLLIKGLQRFRFPCCQLLTVQLPS
jgi:hypothetical protein